MDSSSLSFYGIDLGSNFVVLSEGKVVNTKDKALSFKILDNTFGQKKN